MDFWVLAIRTSAGAGLSKLLLTQENCRKEIFNKGQAILNLLATPHSNSLFFNFTMFLKIQSSQEYLAKLSFIHYNKNPSQ